MDKMHVLPTISQEFAEHAIASMFHASPEQFLKLIDKEGNLFLRFYWSEAAKKLGIQGANPPFGLNYQIREPNQTIKVIMINLPEPTVDGEAYFIALVYRPMRVMMFSLLQDKTAVFLLEKVTPNQTAGTMISRIDHRFNREELESGGMLSKDEFYERVLEILKKEG